MKKYDHFTLFFCCLAGCLAIVWFWFVAGNEAILWMESPGLAAENLSLEAKKVENRDAVGLHPNFYNKANFDAAIGFALDIKPEKSVKAIIVPHDMSASKYSAALIRRAGGREIKRVFVIGPNHENIGDYMIASCHAVWETPFGKMETDRNTIHELAARTNLNLSSSIFVAEHSIGVLVPFIKHYYPNAKLVPLALNSYFDMQKAEILSSWLAEEFGPGDLIVFSIDFSHYLTKLEADKMDIITIEMIEREDMEKILKLTNDNVDSPGALATALLLAQKMGMKKDLIYHSNTFDLAEAKTSQTTSHLSYVFSIN